MAHVLGDTTTPEDIVPLAEGTGGGPPAEITGRSGGGPPSAIIPLQGRGLPTQTHGVGTPSAQGVPDTPERAALRQELNALQQREHELMNYANQQFEEQRNEARQAL